MVRERARELRRAVDRRRRREVDELLAERRIHAELEGARRLERTERVEVAVAGDLARGGARDVRPLVDLTALGDVTPRLEVPRPLRAAREAEDAERDPDLGGPSHRRPRRVRLPG